MLTGIERIKELRNGGLSLQTAKKIVRGEELRDLLSQAVTVDDLRKVLYKVVFDLYPKEKDVRY